jgi:hypothetical protein
MSTVTLDTPRATSPSLEAFPPSISIESTSTDASGPLRFAPTIRADPALGVPLPLYASLVPPSSSSLLRQPSADSLSSEMSSPGAVIYRLRGEDDEELDADGMPIGGARQGEAMDGDKEPSWVAR